jgi:hypothetical protein
MPIQRAAIENSSDAFTIVMQMTSTGFIRPMVDILEREAKKTRLCAGRFGRRR